ncbi:MAG: hypothetical protein GY751_24490, partial [Bacteroidetes bacterium]|nr:hypothetical protein [Bacteroidota bacterium]
MKKFYLSVLILVVCSFQLKGQGLTCADAAPFCTDSGANFPANWDGTGVGNGPQAEPGNNYDCLLRQGNPSWFYIEIDNPGSINITLRNSNNIDIDFAMWGPFPDHATATSNCGSLGTPMDCSYSIDAVEFANIPGSATTGQVYLLLITNYENQSTNIIGIQNSGSGSTDCSIVVDPPTVGECSNGNNVTIPNNNGVPASSIITNSGSTGNMNAGTTIEQVCILVQHPGLYQLDIWLYEPNGTGINLTNANGGEGDNYGNVSTGGEVCFSPTATIPITSYSGGQTGYYIPEQPLSTFSGDPNGAWTLSVWDNQYGHFGQILSWSITFSNGNCSDYCVVYNAISDDFCAGDSYDFNGDLLTIGGVYSDTLSGAAGCDSVVALTLTEHAEFNGTLDTTVCIGNTFVFNGTTYGNGNMNGTEVFSTGANCDSTIVVTVNEFALQSGVLDSTVCTGATFIFNSTVYGNGYMSGTEVLTDANGCDSAVTVTVTEYPIQTGVLDTTVCSGVTFNFNGTTYGGATLSGTEVLTDANGCDSTVTVTVNEYPVQTGVLDTTVCSGVTFNFNGTTYGGATLSGTEVLTDANGCDSAVTVTVNEYLVQAGIFDTTVCSGATFDFNGTTYGGATLSGTEVFTDVNGCDSAVTVSVTELPALSGSFDTTVCLGSTFVF